MGNEQDFRSKRMRRYATFFLVQHHSPRTVRTRLLHRIEELFFHISAVLKYSMGMVIMPILHRHPPGDHLHVPDLASHIGATMKSVSLFNS